MLNLDGGSVQLLKDVALAIQPKCQTCGETLLWDNPEGGVTWLESVANKGDGFCPKCERRTNLEGVIKNE